MAVPEAKRRPAWNVEEKYPSKTPRRVASQLSCLSILPPPWQRPWRLGPVKVSLAADLSFACLLSCGMCAAPSDECGVGPPARA